MAGPIPLPTNIHKYTIQRSVHVDKKSREQFEMRVHKRLMDILEPTQQTVDALGKLSLPAGVDVEIKLNKNGMLRLNIFSHAADRFSNYLDQTQRNGAGIVYQQDFDTFKEFFRKLLRKKDLPDMAQPRITVPPPLSVQ